MHSGFSYATADYSGKNINKQGFSDVTINNSEQNGAKKQDESVEENKTNYNLHSGFSYATADYSRQNGVNKQDFSYATANYSGKNDANKQDQCVKENNTTYNLHSGFSYATANYSGQNGVNRQDDWCPPGFQDLFSDPTIRLTMSTSCCGPKVYSITNCTGIEFLTAYYNSQGCSNTMPIYMYSPNQETLAVINDLNDSCWGNFRDFSVEAPVGKKLGKLKINVECCSSKVLTTADVMGNPLFFIRLSPDHACCSTTYEYSVMQDDREVAHITRKPNKCLQLQYIDNLHVKDKILILASVILCDISQQSDEDTT